MQTRENAVHQWLKTIYPDISYTLTPLAGDASFRRYYRLQHATLSQIVMDSPPDKVPLEPFVQLGTLLHQQGILTPQVHAFDYKQGFALLEDFGNILLRDGLNKESTDHLYQSALNILIRMQENPVLGAHLDAFDQAFMLQELDLFHEWFLNRHLGLTLSGSEHQLLDQTFKILTEQIADQPQVFIHRDYHSRNIMLIDHHNQPQPKFGIIDFQDAMLGPFTYDLVSLLKDCYILLPQDQLTRWLQYFHQQSKLAQGYTFNEFQHAFDWCGLQRHLKVLGIFCRLHLRDNKPNYLADLPLTFHYVLTCVNAYEELRDFGDWLKHKIPLSQLT